MQSPAEIVAALGYELLEAKPLGGGVSARTHKIQVRDKAGQKHTWVIKQPIDGKSYRPAKEGRFLDGLDREILPAPELVYFNEETLITKWVKGSPEPPRHRRDLVAGLVMALMRTHTYPWREFNLDLTDLDLPPLAISDCAKLFDSCLLQELLQELVANKHLAEVDDKRLVHGDFWPGNLFWHGDEAVILDWEDVAVGDPVSDLSNLRLEVLWLWGPAVMESLTYIYGTAIKADTERIRFWDLVAALRPVATIHTWGLPTRELEEKVANLEWFVREALT